MELETKKPSSQTPFGTASTLWALTTPCGAGVWLDGFLVGVPIPTFVLLYNRIQINATVRINYLCVAKKQPVSYADRTVSAADRTLFKHTWLTG